MARHNDIGQYGEWIAHQYMLTKGYKILERNWRYSKAEIDIICFKQNIVVFCEVKCRSNISYGGPESFVSAKKERLMFDAANVYMEEQSLSVEHRFDIIAIHLQSFRSYAITHFKDVFFPGFL